MPFVNLKIAGHLSVDQKKELVKEFSESLERIAGKSPKFTYVVIEEVERANWGIGGKLLSEPKV